MKYTTGHLGRWTLLLVTLLSGGTSAKNAGEWLLQGGAAWARFPAAWQIDSGLGWGGGVRYRSPAGVTLALEGYFHRSGQAFQVVGGGEEMVLKLSHLVFLVAAPVVKTPHEGEVLLSGGPGLLTVRRPIQLVSLGALGKASLPGRKTIYGILSLGMVWRRSLSARIRMHLAPQAMLLNSSDMRLLWTVKGGLSFVLR